MILRILEHAGLGLGHVLRGDRAWHLANPHPGGEQRARHGSAGSDDRPVVERGLGRFLTSPARIGCLGGGARRIPETRGQGVGGTRRILVCRGAAFPSTRQLCAAHADSRGVCNEVRGGGDAGNQPLAGREYECRHRVEPGVWGVRRSVLGTRPLTASPDPWQRHGVARVSAIRAQCAAMASSFDRRDTRTAGRRARYLGRALRSVGFGIVIGLCITVLRPQRVSTTLIYSMCIALLCWFFIEIGRYLVAVWVKQDNERAGWPGWRWMMAVVIVGSGLGFLGGTLLGDLLTGRHAGPVRRRGSAPRPGRPAVRVAAGNWSSRISSTPAA